MIAQNWPIPVQSTLAHCNSTFPSTRLGIPLPLQLRNEPGGDSRLSQLGPANRSPAEVIFAQTGFALPEPLKAPYAQAEHSEPTLPPGREMKFNNS